jgi:hypothetical protein
MPPSLLDVDGRDINDVIAAIAQEYTDWSNANAYVVGGAEMRQLLSELDMLEAHLEAVEPDIYWHTAHLRSTLLELPSYDPYPEKPPICKYLKRIQ